MNSAFKFKLIQALKIIGKSLGTDHPDYATCLNNLSVLHKSMGQYEQALGENHPTTVKIRENLESLP